MASLSCQKNGVKIVQFVDQHGRRRSLRLGKCNKRYAERFKLKLESLIFAKAHGIPPDEETSRWLADLDRATLERMAKLNLVPKPSESLLIPFIEKCIEQREHELKPRTLRNWRNMLDHASKRFGPTQTLRDFTAGDAQDFRTYLLKANLAESTVRKLCGLLQNVFTRAIDHEILTRNPFRKVPTRIRASGKDKSFITRETIFKVIDACPNAESRALVAIARFGGLRIISEINGLKWGDVLWDENRIISPSPKTERFENRDKRIVPLFPELRPYLEDLWEPGETFVFPTYRNRASRARDMLKKAIEIAKVERWSRLFHNLRASRQTELEETFPRHVVCAWLGNTEDVAQESYLLVTDDHFSRALQSAADSSALHSALHHPARTEHAPGNPATNPEKTMPSRCVEDAGKTEKPMEVSPERSGRIGQTRVGPARITGLK